MNALTNELTEYICVGSDDASMNPPRGPTAAFSGPNSSPGCHSFALLTHEYSSAKDLRTRYSLKTTEN